jgi:hypothetical protein
LPSLTQVKQALIDTITNYTATELFGYTTVADLLHLPAVVVEPSEITYTESMAAGMDLYSFNMFVCCNRSDSETGQEQLDGFVAGWGPDSIRQALFQTPGLGIGATDTVVLRMVGYGGTFEDSGNIPMVGAVLKVRVYTDPRA